MNSSLPPPPPAYRRLQEQVAALDWVCPGSVQQRRKLGARQLLHPIYQWTRKVKGKTVTVNLTLHQFQRLKVAIGHQRRLTRLIASLQKLTAESIFAEND
jgi:hypothetical protein